MHKIHKKYLGIFPLVHSFKSTNILRAFVLNSIAIAVIAVFTVEIKRVLDESGKLNNSLRVFVTFLFYKS